MVADPTLLLTHLFFKAQQAFTSCTYIVILPYSASVGRRIAAGVIGFIVLEKVILGEELRR
jgi:hypothetical protein